MKKKTQTLLFTALIVLAIGVSACASSGGQTSLSLEDLANTRWQLSKLGEIGAEVAAVEGTPVTLEIGPDGVLTGSAGCNTFGGSATLEDGKLTVGEVTSTLIACADQVVMDQEEQFLTALRSATGIELDGDELTILYNEGKSALRFLAAQATPTQ